MAHFWPVSCSFNGHARFGIEQMQLMLFGIATAPEDIFPMTVGDRLRPCW
jgi:hypothetical protein